MTDSRLSRKDLGQLCEGLLWDVPADSLSWDDHRDFVIGRVLSRGKLHQIQSLRDRVGDQTLADYLTRTRGRALDRQRLRFFETILYLPEAQVTSWLTDPERRVWDER